MNFLSSIMESDIIRALGWTLLHSLWQGVAIFMLAAGSLILLRNYGPKARYAVLSACLALIPVTFLITFTIVYQPITLESDRPAAVQSFAPGTPSQNQLLNQDAASLHGVASILNLLDAYTPWMFVLWLAGFLVLAFRFSGSLFYLNRLRRKDAMDIRGDWAQMAGKLARQTGLKTAIRLAESAHVKVPLTIGHFKPLILLPLGLLSGLPVQQVEVILLHEMVHISRKDYLFNMIQSVIEMLFFYNPVTWYLSNHIRQEREHICDDIVLSIHQDRLNYIKALTTMEELNSVKSPVLANALTGTRKKLLCRVKRLLNPENLHRGISEGVVGFLFLAMIVVALSANAISYAMSGEESPSAAGLAEYSAGIPTAFDLSGRESGEKVTNFLPVSFVKSRAEQPVDQPDTWNGTSQLPPDTIITKSESGKVTVKVIRDTAENGAEQEMRVIVESRDDSDIDKAQVWKEEKVIRIKSDRECEDHPESMIIIKNGDTIRACDGHYKYVIPGEGESFDWETIPRVPEIPDLHEFYYNFGDSDKDGAKQFYFNFKNDSIDTAFFFNVPVPPDFELNMDPKAMDEAMRAYENAMREYEWQWQEYDDQAREFGEQQRELERMQRDMERQHRDAHVFVYPPDVPEQPYAWNYGTPDLTDRSTEKVIRQELREDGLVERGKSYIIQISPKEMYINGVKQGKEISKKYRHLVDGLEPGLLDDNGTFKLVF